MAKHIHVHVYGGGRSAGKTRDAITLGKEYSWKTHPGTRVRVVSYAEKGNGRTTYNAVVAWKSEESRMLLGTKHTIPYHELVGDSAMDETEQERQERGPLSPEAYRKLMKGKGKSADAPTYTQEVYKGYLIINSIFNRQDFYIKKGGHHIGTVGSLEAAKKLIDGLV